jgi:hypothetical protein|tara:strand:- start:612 stop:920 length:309 start_codon:yes stop_codon:yes gene_type:complete
MLDSVLGVLSNNSSLMVGGGASAMVLWVLKKVPNEHICSVIETACESVGRVMTLGLSKWSVTKNVWNSTIEPWFIDLVDNIFGSIVRGFIKGLRADDKVAGK